MGSFLAVSVIAWESDELRLEPGKVSTEMVRRWEGRRDTVLLGDIVIWNMAGLRGCRALVIKCSEVAVTPLLSEGDTLGQTVVFCHLMQAEVT